MSRRNQRPNTALQSKHEETAANDIVDDRAVRRKEAAEYIGVSESTLRRLERTVLPPTIENGIHLHSTRALFEYKLLHLKPNSPDTGFDGVIAAAAFEAFDRQLGPTEVVKLLRVTPAVARELFREWADLKGAVAIGGEALLRIERVAWVSDEVKTADDLVRVLEEFDAGKCLCCKRRPPRFCAACCVDQHRNVYSIAEARLSSAATLRNRKALERDLAERAGESATPHPGGAMHDRENEGRDGMCAADDVHRADLAATPE